ncbi:transposase [Paucisalibacillus globulus]|uniref:transposase n=1 Tax=Paucisalibacillus globulus TaxID=351095 RepID=UPI0003FFE3A6|nr:transposase [Paucisalibacillus globulus]
MARRPRRQSQTGIYHIMMRGVNRQTIFEEDTDRVRFLETLKKYKERINYQIFAYCLMDNHVHLLMKGSEEELSQSIKRISSSYVYWYNLKYDRFGHLFQGRFKSEPVNDADYFMTVLRYIHQNPIKAGLGKDVFQCKWTSINEYIIKPELVDIELGLKLFSSNRNTAIEKYVDYMQQHNEDECLDDTVKLNLKDEQVREYLYEMGIRNTSMLQQMDKVTRDAVLEKLIQLEGISIRQVSRITGISRSVFERIQRAMGTGSSA